MPRGPEACAKAAGRPARSNWSLTRCCPVLAGKWAWDAETTIPSLATGYIIMRNVMLTTGAAASRCQRSQLSAAERGYRSSSIAQREALRWRSSARAAGSLAAAGREAEEVMNDALVRRHLVRLAVLSNNVSMLARHLKMSGAPAQVFRDQTPAVSSLRLEA